MEIVLSDFTVFEVKDALEVAVGEQVHLLQVSSPEWHRAKLLPHPRSQMKVQRFLSAHGHCHQDTQEAKLDHVIIRVRRWIKQEPVKILKLVQEAVCSVTLLKHSEMFLFFLF